MDLEILKDFYNQNQNEEIHIRDEVFCNLLVYEMVLQLCLCEVHH